MLHPGQQRAWLSDKRFLLVLAGTQSGKTCFGPAWLQREIERQGDGDYLAASASYDLFKLKMLPAILEVFGDQTGWGTYHAGDQVITSKDRGVRIILRSAQSPGGLESATARAAWLDEWGQPDVPVGAWEAVQRRLSLSEGRALITTTAYTMGWLKQQVYDRAVGGERDYGVVSFRSIDNPAFPLAEFERARRTLPSWKFSMFYCGEFTRPAGLIYGDFVDSYRELGGHLVKPFAIPATWLRTVGVDFGATVNNALVWYAEDPATWDVYAYRECCGLNLTGPEHAAAAMAYKEPVKAFWGGSKTEDAARLDWQSAGCPVAEPLITEPEVAIDHGIGLFRSRRLFIFDTLTKLRSELATYSRELDAAGEPLFKIADKERFHVLDAARHGWVAFPLARPPIVQPDVEPDARVRDKERKKPDQRSLYVRASDDTQW